MVLRPGILTHRPPRGARRSASASRVGLALLCVALVLFFGLRYDNFFTLSNAFAILLNISSIAIAAVGAGFLLVSGNVDLSIGGQYALISGGVANVAKNTQSAPVAVLAGLLLGAALGLINGLLIRLLKISPIIVTIGTATIYHGLAYVVTGGVSVFGFPPDFIAIGRSYLGPAPVPVVVAALVFVTGWLVLSRTVLGLRTYAAGGNSMAARLTGVRVDELVTGLYVLQGVLMGMVAVLATARLGSGTPSIGLTFELDVLTAVILGGVGFQGGSGTAPGIFVGVATIGILNAGMIFAGLQDWYQQIARGCILLLALAGDQFAAYRRARAISVEPQADPHAMLETSHQPELAPSPPRAISTSGQTVFTCQDLSKSFGSVSAVRGASFSVAAGEIVCLVGDNGAGKSTLIKMISGVLQPDQGAMTLLGRTVQMARPADARAAGIETVYQDLALCPNLGAASNLVLGKEPTRTRWGWLSLRDESASEAIAQARLLELNIALDDYWRPVGLLSGGQRQSVAIARVVQPGVAMVILDEPTAALGVSQTENVLKLIRRLAVRDAAVLMITHDIETVFAVSDRVVVLRLGQVVFDGPTSSVTQPQLVHLMAGIIPPELRASAGSREAATQVV